MNFNGFSLIKDFFLVNKTLKQTIFKNTFWLLVSTVVNKLSLLVLMIYVARILGATEYGKFNFALAFVALFGIFQDFGISTIVTREFSREGERKKEFHSLISLEILLSVGALILILLGSFFVTHNYEIRKVIIILALYTSVNSMIVFFYAFFQAHQKMEYQSWLDILQVLLRISLGFYVLFNFPSVENLSYAYFFSILIILISVLFFFHFKFFPLKIRWDFLVWKKFLMMSWPLAIAGLFSTIYNSTDSVMLGYFGMITENGWYNAAYKITITTLIPISLISTSFYPVLSKFFKESKERFQKTLNYQLEIVISLSLPLVIGGTVLASKIIYFLYPSSFAPSILAFQILILAAGIIFLIFPLYDAMIVSNQQAKTFWMTLSGAIINVALNLFLIPKYSLYGAAVATAITYFLMLLLLIIFIKKSTIIRLPVIRIFLTFLTSTIATALMYFVIKQPLIYNINIFLLVFIGASIYFMFLFVLKFLVERFRYFYAQRIKE